MKLSAVARFSIVIGALVWVLGLPVFVISSTPFVSDTTYLVFGCVIGVLGLAVLPLALAYPVTSSRPRISVVKGLGALACIAMVVSGALLAMASIGLLGDRAPGWIPDAALICVTGFFAWILLVSVAGRLSTTLGSWAFWLGILAGGSVLLPILILVLMFFLNPGFVTTDTTIPVDLILSLFFGLLIWWCLPIWLIALAAKMPALLAAPVAQVCP